MGTLHVCFADVPHYASATSALAASTLCTTNSTGATYELNGVNAGLANDRISATTMMLHTDLSKDTPPCSLSPGAASSTHSISPTPRFERNMSFFQQLSRRFGLLRSSDDPVFSAAEDDSTDSCSSNIVAMPTVQRSTGAMSTSSPPNGGNAANASNGTNCAGARLEIGDACMKDGHGSSSEHISCASSETSSTADIDDQQQQQRHSPTTTTTNLTAAKERRSSARASFSRLHRRSTSSIRRAFESFSLSTRSLSCSGANAATSDDTPHNAHQRSATNNTPIKSALKYNSNVELNRKTQAGVGGPGCGSSNSANSLHLSSASASTASSAALKSSKGKTKPPPQRILRQPVSYTYLKGISGLPTQRVPRSAVCCQYARR